MAPQGRGIRKQISATISVRSVQLAMQDRQTPLWIVYKSTQESDNNSFGSSAHPHKKSTNFRRSSQ
eukprot:9262028-Prorocentrum_lima.AAC.1